MDKMHSLYREFGQSVWLDYIDRDLLRSGGLALLVQDGLRGVTSNPTIFHQAITGTRDYDDAIGDLLRADPDMDAATLYEWLSIQDVQAAADVLRPVYRESAGHDGYVSLEVSPHLAYELEETVAAARHLWEAVDRPNLMVKVPATAAGIHAVERLLAEGINVNVTLLFSLTRYHTVLEAYLQGVSRNGDAQGVASVASFFLSRIDAKVDPLLDRAGTAEARELRGRTAVASARLAYKHFLDVHATARFREVLGGQGRRQRLLWASTATKDPEYSDVLYVESLVGADTVTTLTPETLDAFEDHGVPWDSLGRDFDAAAEVLAGVEAAGVDLATVTEELEQEGVKKFADSHDRLLEALEDRRRELSRRQAG